MKRTIIEQYKNSTDTRETWDTANEHIFVMSWRGMWSVQINNKAGINGMASGKTKREAFRKAKARYTASKEIGND